MNTQNLKVEVEKLKRQRLRTTLKHMRREDISTQRVLGLFQNDNHIMQEQFSVVNNIHASEIARLSVITHCCLSHLHQISTSVIPYVNMPTSGYTELSQLTYELLRAIQQIKSAPNTL